MLSIIICDKKYPDLQVPDYCFKPNVRLSSVGNCNQFLSVPMKSHLQYVIL